MSKQLAISAAFAVFTMAAMTLALTPDHTRAGATKLFAPMQVELSGPDLPQIPLIR